MAMIALGDTLWACGAQAVFAVGGLPEGQGRSKASPQSVEISIPVFSGLYTIARASDRQDCCVLVRGCRSENTLTIRDIIRVRSRTL